MSKICKHCLYVLVFAHCVAGLAHGSATGPAIDLRQAQGAGVKILKDFHGAPTPRGVLATCEILTPPVQRGVYYRAIWWPIGANRVQPKVFNQVKELQGDDIEGGLFMLLDWIAERPWPLCRLRERRRFHGSMFRPRDTPSCISAIKAPIPFVARISRYSPGHAAGIPTRLPSRHGTPPRKQAEYKGWGEGALYHRDL